LASKRSRSTVLQAPKPDASYAQRVKALVAERDRQIAEIEKLRGQGQGTASGLGKAYALLTRFWSRANWNAREEIIRTLAWLLRLDQIAAGVPATPLQSRK
jgi:hypothetical protein